MLTLASVVGGPQSMTKSHFGLIGLGVMGENLVLNAERNGFSSVVYNRTYSKTEDFLKAKELVKTFKELLIFKIS